MRPRRVLGAAGAIALHPRARADRADRGRRRRARPGAGGAGGGAGRRPWRSPWCGPAIPPAWSPSCAMPSAASTWRSATPPGPCAAAAAGTPGARDRAAGPDARRPRRQFEQRLRATRDDRRAPARPAAGARRRPQRAARQRGGARGLRGGHPGGAAPPGAARRARPRLRPGRAAAGRPADRRSQPAGAGAARGAGDGDVARSAAARRRRAIAVLSDRTRERAVERMRADFVANASHELRTPLASLIGFIETLRGPAADDKPAQRALPRHHGRAGAAHEPADRRPAAASRASS